MRAWLVGPAGAAAAAHLLDAFNREFDTPTPGAGVLTARLERLLAGGSMFAILLDDPPCGIALVSLRPNTWFDGPVALLDELYVTPERRAQGRGAALLAAAISQAQERGAEFMEINVDAEDVDARRFYERHGFACGDTQGGELELYYSRALTDT